MARVGLEMAVRRVVSDLRIEAALKALVAAMAKAGRWGVSLMNVNGAPLYGQDRFEHVQGRLGISE